MGTDHVLKEAFIGGDGGTYLTLKGVTSRTWKGTYENVKWTLIEKENENLSK